MGGQWSPEWGGQCFPEYTNGKPFKVIKFVTMQKNSDKMSGGDITIRNDPRVTKFGKVLRITKLNELPQLVNVFLGDMSIIGPRPLMEIHYNYYPKSIKERIYDVKPGMTGIVSVVLRDEELPNKNIKAILIPDCPNYLDS